MAIDKKSIQTRYMAKAVAIALMGYPGRTDAPLFTLVLGLSIGVGNREAAEALIAAGIPILDDILGGPGEALTEAERVDARQTLSEIASGASLVL